MSARVPRFPASVALLLQQAEGSVSFKYTPSSELARHRSGGLALMETPYERVLVALTLEADNTLTFVRTGSRDEGSRVARTKVHDLLPARHWVVTLTWNAEEMTVDARDQDAST